MTDEARWVIENLKLPDKGTFVEIGAFDGIQGSNTLPFEKSGWGGICIEADPFNAWKCALNRNCETLCAAIGTGELATIRFNIDLDDRGLSGIQRNPTNGKTVLIPLMSLETVMRDNLKYQYPYVSLLSIDTEGSELDAWKSRGCVSAGIVIIEWNTIGKPSNEAAIMERLTADGYILRWRNNVNLIFELCGS